EGRDAGGFLATMLQGVQPERGHRGGIGMPKDAKDPAFLPESVIAVSQIAGIIEYAVGIVFVVLVRHGCLPLKHPCCPALPVRTAPAARLETPSRLSYCRPAPSAM